MRRGRVGRHASLIGAGGVGQLVAVAVELEDDADPVRPRPSITASSGEPVRRLVVAGLGIARFSEFMVAEDLAAGRLVELFTEELIAEPLDITALYLTSSSGLRRLAVFLDWLEEIV
ncbi:hypothetical protein GYB14_09815 [bacterium]|nr:hypothetical protein [bacterium]